MSWQEVVDTFNPATATGALGWAVLLAVVAWILSRIMTRVLRQASAGAGTIARKVDPTMLRYVIHMKTVIIFVLASLVYASLIPALRAVFGTLLASAGVSALVIGFAAKSTLANLISGMALAFYRPIRIGDRVTIEGEYGEIEDITLRHTIVRTWDHRRLIIPNEKLDNMSVTNYTVVDPAMMCRVEIRVSHDTDLDLAKRVFEQQARECPYRNTDADEPWTRVVEYHDYGVTIRIYMWVANVADDWQGRFWLLENVRRACTREGIEIPVPYRAVVLKADPERSKPDSPVPPAGGAPG